MVRALVGSKTSLDRASVKRSFEFLVRMTFSALTDADFLDTEGFMDRVRSSRGTKERAGWHTLERYEHVLTRYLDSRTSEQPTQVVLQRRRVLHWCRTTSILTRGAYSLTVPTGDGKTLSTLAFALRHPVTHGQGRVVVALLFLSILDQTANVFRTIFSPDLGERVLVQPTIDTDAYRLASDNWDAPLIVTTQVQLFESLFGTARAAAANSITFRTA